MDERPPEHSDDGLIYHANGPDDQDTEPATPKNLTFTYMKTVKKTVAIIQDQSNLETGFSFKDGKIVARWGLPF